MSRGGGAALVALALALAGCPAPRLSRRPPPLPLEAAPHHDEPALAGVVHVVRRGETVWRIARAYGIDPGDLMETNGIEDPRAVETGAELFVPGATRVVEVPAGGEPVPAATTSSSTPTSNPTSTATPTATATPTPTPTPTSTSTSTATPTPTPTATRTPTSTSTSTSTAPSNPTPASTRSPSPRVASAGPAPAARASEAPLAWPLKGVLYGRYGVRGDRRHDGIDIAAPEGTTVVAAAAGTVIYAGEQAGYGHIVIVKHEGGLVTLYAHNSRLLVSEGHRVRRGEAIARVGQTGKTSGPHLHFEVRDGTRPRNPLLFLP